MENRSKKDLKNNYLSRKIIGGVYLVKCSGNDRIWIKSTKDMKGLKNRFEFSIQVNSCPQADMYAEWNRYGAKSFSFTILEEIEKGDTQTEQEFNNDMGILLEIWIEKYR